MSNPMRSRGGIAAAALLGLCMMALSAAAQQERPVMTSKDRGDTVKINVSGRVLMAYIYRSSELTFVNGQGGVGGIEPGTTFVEGELGIRFDIELSDKMSVVVEVGKENVDAGATLPFIGGTQTVNEDIVIREAHLMISDFLTQGLKAQFGISTWTFDVRGKGSSFAFDPRHSQSLLRNWSTAEDTVVGGVWAGRGDDPEELNPVGFVMTYSKDNLTVDVVALPDVIEGGNASLDEGLYAVDLWYGLDSMGKGSRLGIIAAISSLGDVPGTPVSGSQSNMVTVGGGVVLKMMDGALEIYGEGYLQLGHAGRADIAGTEEDVKAKGNAFQIGFEYRLPNNANNIWFGANLTSVSGDGDDVADDDVDGFLSYENVGDLAILEDMYYGMDIDSNYQAIKVHVGASVGFMGGTNNLVFHATVGIAKANEQIVTSATEDEDKLGNEFDLRVRWNLNKQVALTSVFGYLVGSDILEEAMGGPGVEDAEDKAILATIGMDVNF
jgi:hypothetical protein